MKSAFKLKLKALRMKKWCKDFRKWWVRKILQISRNYLLIEKKSKNPAAIYPSSNNSKWIGIILENTNKFYPRNSRIEIPHRKNSISKLLTKEYPRYPFKTISNQTRQLFFYHIYIYTTLYKFKNKLYHIQNDKNDTFSLIINIPSLSHPFSKSTTRQMKRISISIVVYIKITYWLISYPYEKAPSFSLSTTNQPPTNAPQRTTK